jgi:hypothetical protein
LRIFSELTSAPDGFLTSQTMQRDLQCQEGGDAVPLAFADAVAQVIGLSSVVSAK